MDQLLTAAAPTEISQLCASPSGLEIEMLTLRSGLTTLRQAVRRGVTTTNSTGIRTSRTCLLSVEALENRTLLAGLETVGGGIISATVRAGEVPGDAEGPLDGATHVTVLEKPIGNPPPTTGGAFAQAGFHGLVQLPPNSSVRALDIFIDGTAAANKKDNDIYPAETAVGTEGLIDGTHKIWLKIIPDPRLQEHDGDLVDVNLSYSYLNATNPTAAGTLDISYDYNGQHILLAGPDIHSPSKPGPDHASPDVVLHATIGETFAITAALDLREDIPTPGHRNDARIQLWATITTPISSTPTPTSDIAMNSATINGSTINYGYNVTGDPGSFTVGLYQSANSTFDVSANLITAQTVNPAPNSSDIGSFQLTFTPSPSRPYLFVVADPLRVIPESNETNNSTNVVRDLAWGARVSPQFRTKVVLLSSFHEKLHSN